MFFAYVCLRPEAASQLEPPPRLRLWRGVLARFFTWVWVAVAVVLASGLALILRMASRRRRLPAPHVPDGPGDDRHLRLRVLHALRRAERAVAAEDWKAGGAALGRIRQLVGTNLTLGS